MRFLVLIAHQKMLKHLESFGLPEWMLVPINQCSGRNQINKIKLANNQFVVHTPQEGRHDI